MVAAVTEREPQAIGTDVRRQADQLRTQRTQDYLARAAVSRSVAAEKALFEEVVMLNLPISDRLALRYSGRGIPSQDLVQVARLGLIKAVHRFDPDAGHDFLSFAVPTIVGELKRHFRDCGWTVRPPRRIQELQPQIRDASSTLTQTLGRTPTRTDIADFLAIDESLVVEALAANGCFSPTSLDQPAPGGSNPRPNWEDALGQTDNGLAMVEAKLALAPIFRGLCDRDRNVLRLRSVDGLTQQEIGRVIGVSQMQVSRILARILRLTRDELAR